MKFKIINKTRFPTRALRSFVVRSYRIARELAGPARAAAFEEHWSVMRITFARSNRRDAGASTGHAHFNVPVAHVGVADQPDPIDVALTIAHEFGHCFGLKHGDMRNGPLDAYHWRAEDTMKEMRVRVFGWGADIPLTPRCAKQPPSLLERRQAKRDRIIERLAAWRAKEKRARNAIKKLTAQLHRVEKLTGDTP